MFTGRENVTTTTTLKEVSEYPQIVTFLLRSLCYYLWS